MKLFIPTALAPVSVPADVAAEYAERSKGEDRKLASVEFIPYLLPDRHAAERVLRTPVEGFRVGEEYVVHLFEDHAKALATKGERASRAVMLLSDVVADACLECLGKDQESVRVLNVWAQSLHPLRALLTLTDAIAQLDKTDLYLVNADVLFRALAEARREVETLEGTDVAKDALSGVFLTSAESGLRVTLREWVYSQLRNEIVLGELAYAASPLVDGQGRTMKQRVQIYGAAMEPVFAGNFDLLGLFSGEVVSPYPAEFVKSISVKILHETSRGIQYTNHYRSVREVFQASCSHVLASLPWDKQFFPEPDAFISQDKVVARVAAELTRAVESHLAKMAELDAVWVYFTADGDTYDSYGLFTRADQFGVTSSRGGTDPRALIPLSVAGHMVNEARNYPPECEWEVHASNPEDQFVLDMALELLTDKETSPLNLLPYCFQVAKETLQFRV
jgi:hypothetical protein